MWLIRRNHCETAGGETVRLMLPRMDDGRYRVTPFNTFTSTAGLTRDCFAVGGMLEIEVLVERDLAVAVRAWG